MTAGSGRKPDQETVRELRRSGADVRATRPAQSYATRPIGDVPPEPDWGDAGAPIANSRTRGDVLGRYVVLSLLGRGGMGEVYTAYDPTLDRRIALKVIHPQADKGSISSARGMLLAEAQALAKLSHPNIIGVYDVGTFDDDVFMAMEYVEGTTLTSYLRSGDHSLPDMLDVFVAAGRGLEAAHAAGIVHRDFKPENVIIGKDGRTRVIDFGIALQARDDVPETISGTPAYMAPEQYAHAKVGPAADQFSFAITLYTAVFGTYPFDGELDAEVSRNIVDGKVRPPPSTPGVSTALRDAILRALSRDPAARFPSMGDLLAAIKPPPSRRRARIETRVSEWLEASETSIAGEWFALLKVEPLTALAYASLGAVVLLLSTPVVWIAGLLLT